MYTDPFGGLMLPWQNAQKPMSTVVRWGNFPDYGQTLTEHNNSIPYVGMWIRQKLQSRSDVDWLLFMEALLVHDQGEPISGGDEHAGNKTPDKDWLEYRAVSELFASVEASFRGYLMKAFLLQYVRKPQQWQYMANEHRDTVVMLAEKYQNEARLFDMAERLDYLASAFAGCCRGIRNDKETMIDHTLRNQIPKLDTLVEEWAPLSGVWSPDLRHQFLSLGSS